jgi:excisionase family DNA binding protein
MTSISPDPLVYSINEAIRLSTLGRTRLYELINSGELKVTRIGRRTLVRADSLRALIAPAD